jgi:predicted nucleotidyltransferase
MEQNKSYDEWVERFIKEAIPKIKEIVKPHIVLLFGSRIKGGGSKESDIDVLIVSDFFDGKPFLGRMPIMLRMVRFPWPIDFLCYTPKEFANIRQNSIIVKEAINEGVEVVGKR